MELQTLRSFSEELVKDAGVGDVVRRGAALLKGSELPRLARNEKLHSQAAKTIGGPHVRAAAEAFGRHADEAMKVHTARGLVGTGLVGGAAGGAYGLHKVNEDKVATDLSPDARAKLPKKDFAVSAKKSNTGDKAYPIPDRCLAGETCISLLDGREVPIKELVGQAVWVYAFDLEKKAVVPALATDVRMTEAQAEVLRITFDNGGQVVCTMNHPFLMRNGEYSIAENLSVGDSLMPLYRKLVQQQTGRKEAGKKFYEQVFQPYYRFWDWTHHFVCREATGQPLAEGSVVHHKDENSLNNLPSNLEEMTKRAHCARHAKETLYQDSATRSRNAKKRWAAPGARERAAEVMRKENQRRQEEGLAKAVSEKISYSKVIYWDEWRGRLGSAQDLYERYLAGEPIRDIAAGLGVSTQTIRNHFQRNRLSLKKELKAKNNHKVANIEYAGHADVYDLTVEGPHNFALTAGVFIHNSHASSALGFAKMHGDSADLAAVRAKIKAKYPDMLSKKASISATALSAFAKEAAGLMGRLTGEAAGHRMELGGLGILAAPSLDDAQAHVRAGLAGDYNAEGVKKRTVLPHAAKPISELAGLGVLAVPSAAHLLGH